MLLARAAAAIVVAALLASTPAPAKALRQEAGDARKFECVFGKEGASSKLTMKLASRDFGEESVVFVGRIWLDKKPLFGQPIKFLYSKTEEGKATLGAGVLTQKRTLYYTELFINFDPESGKATFEAATAGASTTLQGDCKLK
ncbi:hypothetical protein WOC76_14870 [Methylocystis sp. IM3]|uniref:hypothetical protein n=1 Tax=unclassified Methylocystis TaxID=2625913 RepID=UPI00311A0628